MYSITELKTGTTIEINGQPYIILEAAHLKLGRGGAIMRTKLKNLKNGSIINKNFKGADKIKEALVEKKEAQFLYKNNNDYYFMDSQNFEQFSLPKNNLGETTDFLKEGLSLEIFYFNQKPINIELPIKIDLLVKETEPGVKGNTASTANKNAITETGLSVKVPLFIKEGDLIKIDTRNGQYLERA